MPKHESKPGETPQKRAILEVVLDPDLSAEQKTRLLEDWRLDFLELQRATEENMSSANASGSNVAENLRVVTKALAAVRRKESSENHL